MNVRSNKTKRQIEILSLIENHPGEYDRLDLCGIFETGTATIDRDLRELRSLGLPLHSRNKGLSLHDPLTSDQYKALISLYVSASGDIIGFPKNISLTVCQLKERSLNVFIGLIQAIENRRRLRLTYERFTDGRIISTVVEPYQIIPTVRDWRLIAYSGKTFKQYVIHQIKHLVVTDEKFKSSPEYKLSDLFYNSFEYWRGDDIIEVEIRFDAKAAKYICSTIWCENQRITKKNDGSIILAMTVNAIGQVGNWVIGWGEDATVIKPKELKQYVLKLAKGVLKNHPE